MSHRSSWEGRGGEERRNIEDKTMQQSMDVADKRIFHLVSQLTATTDNKWIHTNKFQGVDDSNELHHIP